MPYEILKHTADIRLRVWGKTQKELFEEAAAALLKLMRPVKDKRPAAPVKRRLTLEAANLTELLVDFLSRILTLAQTAKETYIKVAVWELGDTKVAAELDAVKVKEFGEDIKAVTYHEAEVKQKESGEWETLLVLDI
jgi:SHS2 domain-containing protein